MEIHSNLLPFYRFAVENSDTGIHAVDQNGRTIIYNEKMKKIEGLDLEDVGDRSILELFNFEQEESTLLKVLQSGQPQLNVKQTYWNSNGTEITTINDTHPVFANDELIGAIEIAHDVTQIEKFMLQPLKKHSYSITLNQMAAESDSMKKVMDTAKKASQANIPILIIGEAGTGKDLIAENIHYELSPTNRLFYSLFCHSSDLHFMDRLEDELNATQSFTLFCERIDLLSLSGQKKLLGILQSASNPDRQFIASIDEDPVELISSGALLKELYYFFASFVIQVPPLRKRKEDILPFVSAYLAERSERIGSSLELLSPEVKELFLQYDWPGNLRELEFLLNEITSQPTLNTTITFDMLPQHFRLKQQEKEEEPMKAADFILTPHRDILRLDHFLQEAEAYYITKAMKMHDDNITKTASALGMSRQNLQYRLRKMKNGTKA